MKDSEDSLLNKIKDLSEKLDAKRAGLSNIQWTNDLAVLKTCLDDVESIQRDIKALEVTNFLNNRRLILTPILFPPLPTSSSSPHPHSPLPRTTRMS